MLIVIVAGVLLAAVQEAQGMPPLQRRTTSAFTIYKAVASWDEARLHCQSEGAVLASPINKGIQQELRALFNNTFYFIGVEARSYYNKFVSVEGVPLVEMPVTEMYERLDIDDGECLIMNQHEIRVEQCTSRMPYVCYKNDTDHYSNQTDQTIVTPRCNTEGYEYYEATGSCYKIHKVKQSYDDAVVTCASEQAHLLVIDDDNEAKTIGQMDLAEYPYTYTGLKYSNGYWQTVTGKQKESVYHVWYFGNPTCPETCFCSVIRNNRLLDDRSCTELREFICERSPTHFV